MWISFDPDLPLASRCCCLAKPDGCLLISKKCFLLLESIYSVARDGFSNCPSWTETCPAVKFWFVLQTICSKLVSYLAWRILIKTDTLFPSRTHRFDTFLDLVSLFSEWVLFSVTLSLGTIKNGWRPLMEEFHFNFLLECFAVRWL